MTDVEKLKKVKAIINDLPCYMDYQPTKEQDEAFDVVLELLNKAIEEATVPCFKCKYYKETDTEWKSGEWIPVSERLPDKNMPCLVSVGKLNLTQIAMYSDLMETIDHKIFYIGNYGKDDFQNITEFVNAWQPLPEPYKKGGAE